MQKHDKIVEQYKNITKVFQRMIQCIIVFFLDISVENMQFEVVACNFFITEHVKNKNKDVMIFFIAEVVIK